MQFMNFQFLQLPWRKLNQMKRVMKCTAIFLLAASLQVNAIGYAQKITINGKNMSTQKIFKEVNRQAGFNFFYSDALLAQGSKISLNLHDASIEEILKVCFKDLPVTYSIVDKTIVLKPKEKSVDPSATVATNSIVADPPAIDIDGSILDGKGNPLAGVSIVVKGTKQGTTTDVLGKFSLSLNDANAILLISTVGYVAQEIPLKGKTLIKVVLVESTSEIDKVVVVGYGTQIRKNLSSSISTVDPKNLNTVSANSFEAALQGQAAGVQVTQSSALGGSAVSIRIRGASSVVGSSEPLYVIDGIPVESGSIASNNPGSLLSNYSLQTAANTNVLASLNPSDIESIEILKDASAAAIYGSRGANGIVLITTKKGKVGKTQVHAAVTYGRSEAVHKPSFLTGTQYIELAQEAWVNSGNKIDDFWTKSGVLVDGLTKEKAMETNTNWVDQTLQKGEMKDYNISLSGGDAKTNFYLSAFLKDEKTILLGNNYKRYGTRLNIEHKMNKIVTVGAKMLVSHVDDHQVPTAWAGGSGMITERLPIWPVYKDDGSYFYLSPTHPRATIDLRKINLLSNQIYGSWYAKVKIMNGLNFRSEYGLNQLSSDDFHYIDGRVTWGNKTASSKVLGNSTSWNLNNSLNYVKQFGSHNLDVLVAAEAQKSLIKSSSMIGETFFNTALQLPQDASTKLSSYFETGNAFTSYIGRINYDYKGRYLLSLSARSDASSRFAKNNQRGYFPSASVGYNLSEEDFFAPIKKVFNFFKLRASYGIVGNAGIGNHAYYTSYKTVTYNGVTGLTLNNLGDDRLGWEKTAQLDLGLTWEMFDGRISGEVDYYDKQTSNLLLAYPVSQLTGVSQVLKNVGELSNKGIDIGIKTVNIKTKNFTWQTSINLNQNENKLLKIRDGVEGGLTISQGLGNYSVMPGMPVGILQMVEWKGVDPATGEDTYLEVSTGSTLRYSEIITKYKNFAAFDRANKGYFGRPWPKYTGGINNSFTWKNWNLNVLFTFVSNINFSYGDIKRMEDPFGSYKINPAVYFLNRWQNPGDITNVSKLSTQNINWAPTTEQLYNTDFIRLKDLTLGYTFNPKKANSPFRGLRCYVRGSNLLTFTKAPDMFWDPEFMGVGYSNTNALGADKQTPQAKFYMVGLSFDF